MRPLLQLCSEMRLWMCTLLLTVFTSSFAVSATAGDLPLGLEIPAISLPSLPASAEGEAVVEHEVAQVRARLLISEIDGRQHAGVLFDLEPGWHLYWRNPGGTGIAPDLGLEVDGMEVGEVEWPAPLTFQEADGLFTTYGYEGSVLLSAPLEPSTANAGPQRQSAQTEVRANVRALVCRTQCVPIEFTLTSALTPSLAVHDHNQINALFLAERSRVPLPASELGIRGEALWKTASPNEDDLASFELHLETCTAKSGACPRLARELRSPLFLPIDQDTFEFEKTTVLSEDLASGRAILSIEATRLEAGPDRLHGLLSLVDQDRQPHHVEIELAIQPRRADSAAAKENGGAPISANSEPPIGWLKIFALALLGGLILNGMPCVLPVLAIKIVAVADMAEKDPREVRMHGIAYTAGVLGSMALLAGLVLALRAAGHSVGWGFQFQEPLFVAAIAAVLVTFALNLFGIFEIELGQGRLATLGQDSTGPMRSVFEGLLAVVLATPCTAPFLGTAVGFAFASGSFGIAAIFLAIGLGLASPFLMVSFFPQTARFIPRSGPWMNQLRAGLGFSLLATVIWLLWVLGQGGGVESVVATTGVLLFLSFLLWGFGQLQPLRSIWVGRASALMIATFALTGFNLIELDRSADAQEAVDAQTGETIWSAYSVANVAAALEKGRPAFVVFTADWCITCQVNERTVLKRETVMNALADADFALFKADWTRRDDGIRQKLAEFGRAGVPLYLVYHPDAPNDPQILSELLTTDEVVTALRTDSSSRRI